MPALYRKYRPTVFGDVIEQQHITRTLINQVKSGHITHAYLFTGSRGTGKTTCARIFARAVNCLNPVDGSPCGKCKTCLALSGNDNIDIVELDAASNNGVDQIREIVENVQYPPVAGKYKVYIVDEVHMLSASAFNALLKTLEEPPAHAVFILATTEVHKLPATVLSRCMRFDFRLVGKKSLKDYLKKVYAAEGVRAEEEALDLIATAAEGSVRDMLSVADRCMNFSSDLTYKDVLEVLGSGGRESTRALFNAVALSDTAAILSTVDKLCAEGKSVGVIAKDVCSYARDVLVLKASPSASVTASREDVRIMKEEAEKYSVELLVSVINVFSSVDAEIRYSVSPRVVLECAALRAAKLAVTDLSSIEERLTRLERRLTEDGVKAFAASDEKTANSERVPKTHAPVKSETDKPMDARSVWGRLLTYFRLNESAASFSLLSNVTDVEVRGDKLIVWAAPDSFLRLSDDEMTGAITRALDYDGAPYKLTVNKKSGGVDMDSEIARIKKMIGDAKLNIKK